MPRTLDSLGEDESEHILDMLIFLIAKWMTACRTARSKARNHESTRISTDKAGMRVENVERESEAGNDRANKNKYVI